MMEVSGRTFGERLGRAGPDAEPTFTSSEVHPGEAGVEPSAPELAIVHGPGIVRREEGIEGLVDESCLRVGGDGGFFENGHPASFAHRVRAVVVASVVERVVGTRAVRSSRAAGWCSRRPRD